MKIPMLTVWLCALSLVLPALVGGCHSATAPPEEETSQAPVQAEPAIKMQIGEWTDLFGSTQPLPNCSARISTSVEGHVIAVLGDGKGSVVVEGQQVKPGQVIVRLDDRVLRANAAKLQETFKDLEEQQKQAGFAMELATIDVNRLKELIRSSSANGAFPSVSQVEVDKANVLQRDAQSKMKSVAAKQAGALADLKSLEEQMEFYTLRAPIAGRLGMVQAVPGQTLSPGTIVADVLDLDQIDVLCYAPPDAVAKLALDQPAKLLLEEVAVADHKQPLLGKVVFIGVQAQPETGNVPIKVRFPNPNSRIRAHAVVRVHVLTQPEKERLTIPEAAIVADRDIPTVVAVQDIKAEKKAGVELKTGKVRHFQVVLGIRDRDRRVVEILGAADPATKERVAFAELLFVTAGGNGLQNDDPVRLLDNTK